MCGVHDRVRNFPALSQLKHTFLPTIPVPSLPLSPPLFPQVADETGEVQYATHLVTVTEKDSKALGQPVGSTTTVLLTAYPGGHSGGMESGTESNEQLIAPPTTSATVPNVQVCIYNSHICMYTHIGIPDTIGTEHFLVSCPFSEVERVVLVEKGVLFREVSSSVIEVHAYTIPSQNILLCITVC